MGITINIEKKGEWERLLYSGPINEDTEVHLNPVIPSLGPCVVINFKNVAFVNSCGVRAWINFLREAEKNRKLVFEECTPEIVSQINMIPSFRGRALIYSVYGSYSCPNCEHTTWKLFERGKNLPSSSTSEVPHPACDKCKTPMEMEEFEEEFFAWIDAA
jgi:hypothetical protein